MPREKRIDYKEKLSIKSHIKMGVLNEKRCKDDTEFSHYKNEIIVIMKLESVV